ncbi:uncharacterized protein EI97DRAFT_433863 [Westerdykella ornata]|uniref:Uncharacterized protein n=1 Tax=Westerdykella ornata TaxID=318751 RepID=A0A6A6JGZ4_WESOR|nr:uncharacterized protein EI97DRAFT_433863 [Westerdykella ornata]KAF2275930.1 hypothetical protein EI97DRAFT_433863 [Westerdykella ornata]
MAGLWSCRTSLFRITIFHGARAVGPLFDSGSSYRGHSRAHALSVVFGLTRCAIQSRAGIRLSLARLQNHSTRGTPAAECEYSVELKVRPLTPRSTMMDVLAFGPLIRMIRAFTRSYRA